MKRLYLAIVMLTLSGCNGGDLLAPSGDPAKLYTLAAPAEIATTAPPARWQLLIDAPDAPMALDSVRIAVTPEPNRLDYYAGIAWADRPAAMLQDMIVQSFDRSGRIDTVQRQGGGLRADFVLTSDLQDFEVDTPTATVHVRVTARLVRTRDRAIVASHTFDAQVPVHGGFDSAVAGFDGALNNMLPAIVTWTLTQGGGNQ